MGITYDTGALIAADRGERRMWARHRALLTLREVPTVPAPVVAQSWRGGSRQALLARLLAGCVVEALDDGHARAVGSLAATAATSDIVNTCVVEGALRRHDLVVSSDETVPARHRRGRQPTSRSRPALTATRTAAGHKRQPADRKSRS